MVGLVGGVYLAGSRSSGIWGGRSQIWQVMLAISRLGSWWDDTRSPVGEGIGLPERHNLYGMVGEFWDLRTWPDLADDVGHLPASILDSRVIPHLGETLVHG